MLTLAVTGDLFTRKKIEALRRPRPASPPATLKTSLANAEVVQTLGMADALIARWRSKNVEVAWLQAPTARCTVAMAALTRTLRQAASCRPWTPGW